ncbi:MAG: hypothetical protein WBE39_16645 [Candidatus Competibacter sp.]
MIAPWPINTFIPTASRIEVVGGVDQVATVATQAVQFPHHQHVIHRRRSLLAVYPVFSIRQNNYRAHTERRNLDIIN